GQFDAAKTLELVQKLDQTRTVDHASGWHDQKVGDFKSLHVYFRPYKFKPDKLGRCVILTEFGGFSHAVKGHSHIAKKEFGYKKEGSLADFEQSMIDLYQQQITPAKNMGLSAAILTQLSDVEDEVNGLVTYDRQVVKIPTKTIRKLNSHLHF
ncbi:MAG: glycoside hydrolase family 2, partial [Clostridia bacterium]|nr:glycoside hydrolase family 2 [Clostridia bacterium]